MQQPATEIIMSSGLFYYISQCPNKEEYLTSGGLCMTMHLATGGTSGGLCMTMHLATFLLSSYAALCELTSVSDHVCSCMYVCLSAMNSSIYWIECA